ANGLETRTLLLTLLKLAVCAVPLALICLAAERYLLFDLAHMRFRPKLGAVLGTIGLAATAFFAGAHWLRIAEMRELSELFIRKFAPRSRRS
ncbi:MAG: hypothetical protein M3O82_00990, partial [Verrucomicrobiota bacterium]|nr:hypothetical protein [Verrucomicrobiota bacterium]